MKVFQTRQNFKSGPITGAEIDLMPR